MAHRLTNTLPTLLISLTFAGLGWAPALAQQVIRLPAQEAVLPHAFSAITSVRELEGGRLLVSDSREQRIALADFAGGSPATVGRLGNGPGEYSVARPLFATGRDSSIMFDGTRWLLLSRDRIVGQVRAPGAGPRIPVGADAKGRVLVGLPPAQEGRVPPGKYDSLTVAVNVKVVVA
jgi:hypothetical protein